MATSTWLATTQTGDATYADDAAPTHNNHRFIIKNAYASTSGTQVRFRVKGHSSTAHTIEGMTIGLRDGTSDDFSATPTQMKSGGSVISSGNPFTYGGGTDYWTDWVDFTFNEAVDHLVHFWYENGADYNSVVIGSGEKYYGGSTGDDSLTLNVSYISSSYLQNLAEIEVQTVSAGTILPQMIQHHGG